MQVGSLVRVRQANEINPLYLGKLAIVVVKGAWSVDIAFMDPSISWSIRTTKEHLEVLCK